MATSLTAEVAESRCRQRIADVAADIWTPSQMMEALDDSLNSIWTMVRTKGQDRLLERVDVLPSDFTSESVRTYRYTLPAWAGPIRLVEGISGSGNRGIEILPAELDIKDYGQSSWSGSTMVWFRSQTSAFTISGEISRFSAIRVWFLRRWPPMHYGVTSGVGTGGTLVLSTSPVGRIVRRDVYESVELEITSGVHADQVVRVTDFDPTTLVVGFTPTLGSSVGVGESYSTVVPVDPEHGEYVIEEMASRFLERSGNVNYIAAKDSRLMRLRAEFLSDLMHRDQAAPPTLWSHR